MDYTNWAQMQQNPNPNSNLPHTQTTPSASYSYNPVSDPYQQPSSIDSAPQPRPPGVDPPYVPPPATVNYAQPPFGYETQPPTVNYAQQAIGYEPQMANVNYAQQPLGYEQQQGADAAVPASYYSDPYASWASAIFQLGAKRYAALERRPKNVSKTTKVVQSAWCEVCKVDCNTKSVLDRHKLGKKHLKNLENLKPKPDPKPTPAITASTPAVTVDPPAVVTAPPTTVPAPASLSVSESVIGPKENPEKPKLSNGQKARKRAGEDLETKRQKVLKSGAAADSVHECSICNVVCTGDTAFNFHLSGQKHASRMKKHGLTAGVSVAR